MFRAKKFHSITPSACKRTSRELGRTRYPSIKGEVKKTVDLHPEKRPREIQNKRYRRIH